MNNYEKIMLALFAIQHTAYNIQSCNDTIAVTLGREDELAAQRCENRDKLLGECITKLSEIMETLGEISDAMDANMGIDIALMQIPYDIVYGRKDPEDYDE